MQTSRTENCCQLCGSAPLEDFVVPGRTTFRRCASCGLYQDGRFLPGEAYEAGYHISFGRQSHRKTLTAAVRLNRIAPVVAVDRPSLLDIGCSVGCVLEAARRRNWRATGVDVARDMVTLCREKGFDAHCTSASDGRLPFADQTFDVVTAWHVIEHVADVQQSLAEWQRVLKEDGILAIETPNAACARVRRRGASYRNFWCPGHTYTFTPATLANFFRRAGFELVPRPWLGRPADLSPAMAAYAIAYQAHQGLKQLIGMNKAFQIFARRAKDTPNQHRAVA